MHLAHAVSTEKKKSKKSQNKIWAVFVREMMINIGASEFSAKIH